LQVLCALDSALNDLHSEHAQARLALAEASAENARLVATQHPGSKAAGQFDGGALANIGRASAPVSGC